MELCYVEIKEISNCNNFGFGIMNRRLKAVMKAQLDELFFLLAAEDRMKYVFFIIFFINCNTLCYIVDIVTAISNSKQINLDIQQWCEVST